MIILCFITGILAVTFFRTENIIIQIICFIIIAIMWISIYFEMKNDSKNINTEHEKSIHRTKKVEIKYTCFFTSDKQSEANPIVMGQFTVNPIDLNFMPQKRTYEYMAKRALEEWMYEHFEFAYTVEIEGEKFNGAFKPAEFNRTGQKQAGHGKSNEDKESSDP